MLKGIFALTMFYLFAANSVKNLKQANRLLNSRKPLQEEEIDVMLYYLQMAEQNKKNAMIAKESFNDKKSSNWLLNSKIVKNLNLFIISKICRIEGGQREVQRD